MRQTTCDVVVIGSGIAGLSLALSLPKSCKVVVISTHSPLDSGATRYAQGGIAFALDDPISIDLHIQDTLKAGAGLCDEAVVRETISNSFEALRWLEDQGALFDRNAQGKMDLGMEAAHSRPRIAHIKGDSTGVGLCEVLFERCTKQKHIDCIYGSVSGLLMGANDEVCGVVGEGFEVLGANVVLATGGASSIFTRRTTPMQDNLRIFDLAMQAGALASDMEFFQHHPTALQTKNHGDHLPLVSEAVRGKGAFLVTAQGALPIEHPLGSLAPRDVVARAVFQALNQGKKVFLDTSKIPNFADHFPSISAVCKAHHIDTGCIPVCNAVHYQIGGIDCQIDGTTNVQGLYVIGEASATGLHGANRLASNSLLEGVVMARLCAKRLQFHERPQRYTRLLQSKPMTDMDRICAVNDRFLGIVRDAKGLQKALGALKSMPWHAGVMVSVMATVFALLRQESIGVHYRSDCPDTLYLPRRKMSYGQLLEELQHL